MLRFDAYYVSYKPVRSHAGNPVRLEVPINQPRLPTAGCAIRLSWWSQATTRI